MRLEIHGRIKDYEFLLQTFCVVAGIVVVVEMGLESVVIEEIAWVVGIGDSITQMATLVSVTAVGVKLITSVESLSAEAALWVTLETSLLRRTGCVVASPLVLPQLLWCEKLVFMCEDLLVSRTKIAHDLLMHCAHVAMEIWPSQASSVAT